MVEIKLSRNGKLVQGYEKQLELYDKAESSFASRYVIINVGGLGEKYNKVEAARDKRILEKGEAPKTVWINGLPKASASKS